MIMYICDRTKCGDRCTPECHHTSGRFYARDAEHEFVEIGGNLWEKPKPWDDFTLGPQE